MARRVANWPAPTDAADEKACEICGAIFYRNIHWSWEQWQERRYCSQRCLGTANKASNMGRGMNLDHAKHALALSFQQAGVAYGECQCGCGGTTRIAKQSWTRDGSVNGEPVRFLKGHGGRHCDLRRSG